MHRHPILLIILAFGAVMFVACGGETPTEIFIPPTLAATPVPVAPPTATAPAATPTPLCGNQLRFLEDLTIPDRTAVVAGNELDKRWLVENNGSCNWDVRYQLKLVAGLDMGAATEQTLYPARSGAEAVIRIIFTAPDEPGLYTSSWQAFDPAGEPFGDPIFIEVVVE